MQKFTARYGRMLSCGCEPPTCESTFGANGTSPDVTQTTGLEVVKPIDGRTIRASIPAANSAEVDPMLQFALGKNGALDKAGKDNNYRGVTEYRGALYFTKGSGSNGMDTVYTVGTLPTVDNAASQKISVVPGFPTDSARSTGRQPARRADRRYPSR